MKFGVASSVDEEAVRGSAKNSNPMSPIRDSRKVFMDWGGLGFVINGTFLFCVGRESFSDLNLLVRKKNTKSLSMLGLFLPSIYFVVGVAIVLLPLVFLPYGSKENASPWMIVLTIIRIFFLLLLMLFCCLGVLASFEPGQGHLLYRLVFGILAILSLGSMIYGLYSLIKK